jgi:glycosyltransferase involved in cell wall biosynthesis
MSPTGGSDTGVRDDCAPMRFSIVTRVPPLLEGGPPHRAVRALGDGLVAEGHEVDCWAWGPERPDEELPSWVRWEPLPPDAAWRVRARAVVRPRHGIRRAGWAPAPGAIALAEDPISYLAVDPYERSAVTFHYLSRLDVPALRFPKPSDVQNWRAERHAARRSKLVLAFSDRVGRLARADARVVPIGYPMPDDVLPTLERPTALLFANWEWPPNARALTWMLELWPDVRARVAGAELILAGWGLDRMGVAPGPGVRAIGSVARSVDALSEASVLAFPCPPTSGPKIKVIEALSFGLPVVTTEYGVEGVWVDEGEGAVVADRAGFAAALSAVLEDPERRRHLGSTGRAAMVGNHSAEAVARTRVATCAEFFGLKV